ncbi:alpha/beta hydrolase [Pseudonocardia asaccharolytica]|uniref:Alpha/beta hydrolase n=1 Tax=Pseudonocardia asaccharolytica DSM 44247 = NBRC 16224 TaxID=1123024 RepID=A0A511D0X3_9PSEU|nr:alpha/beta hydrolase [Pseudonocardia asaccharolytica]GEL18455.1 alpha/beta hydrolase [Pseudonocardia asaccharolytica DSM 44247 = NBRC 16224]
MEKTTSADGTTLAFDVWGSGPLVVIVGGAFNDRHTWVELAQALADQGFRVASYDRRGRGDSGDPRRYGMQHEIDDLIAVIGAAGADGPVFAHGVSSGGGLLLHVLAAGVPVARASVLEPPYRIEGAPLPPENYIATLRGLVEADDRAGLVEYFHTRVVGMPGEMLEPMKGSPMWDSLLAMAPTLVHDGIAMGGDDQSLPVGLLAGLTVPVLAVTSTGTQLPWLSAAAGEVAAAVPGGRLARLEGGFHEVPAPVLAPSLARFYGEGGTR